MVSGVTRRGWGSGEAFPKEREAETRRSAVSGPSFKKFLRTIRDAAQRRLILEKSLLLEAFSRRGE